MSVLKEFTADKLAVKVMETRAAMGVIAGSEIADRIRELQGVKDEINIIFAAAPSQNEVLETLVNAKGIDWSKVNAFHMDEYVGLPSSAPQGFGNFLKSRIFSKLNFRSVSYIDGCAENLEDECIRYSELLKNNPIDIVCMGIGENGHIAFNDPWVAEFNDKMIVKAVELDEVCRQQQVNDGCFEKLSDVPQKALTLTIPTLMSGKYIFCSVPAKTKAQAVQNTVKGEISEKCPATILRKHKNAILYCDADSGINIL